MTWTSAGSGVGTWTSAGSAVGSFTADTTKDQNAWYQLSVYTLNDADGNVDFILRADEQYPIYVYDNGRDPITLESGYSQP